MEGCADTVAPSGLDVPPPNTVFVIVDAPRAAALEHYLLAFQHRYEAMAQPFRWTFTRADLHRLLANLSAVRPAA